MGPWEERGSGSMPYGCAALQTDLGRLEKWAKICKVPCSGRNNPRHEDRLGAGKQLCREGLGGHQVEREPGVPLGAKKPPVSWTALGTALPAGQGR